MVGYFAEWGIYGRNHVSDIPAEKLTDINYAFANINSMAKSFFTIHTRQQTGPTRRYLGSAAAGQWFNQLAKLEGQNRV